MIPFCRKKEAPKEAVIANLDYDKLAEAIVKAQRKAREEECEADITAYLSKRILQTAFFVGGLLLLVFSVCGIILLFKESYPIERTILQIMLCVAAIMYAIISFCMIKSIRKIKDRNYLVGFFSALVALTALIVAIIKG